MNNKTRFFLLAALLVSAVARAQQGLTGEYFNGQNFEEKVLTRTDAQVNFNWWNVAPAPGVDAHVFSVRWTGQLIAPESGEYRFRANVDDGVRVRLNGQPVIDAWGLHDSEQFTGTIELVAGRRYTLQVEYFNAINEGEIQLFWQLPSEKPVFGGLLGYNDRLIEGRYFLTPPQPVSAKAQPTPQPAATAPKPRLKPAPKPPVAQNKPAPKPAAALSADTLDKYLPKNILFEQSKSIMLAESYPELDRLAGFLLRNPAYRLTINGHTDNLGDSAKNMALSEDRARTVAAYLVKKGIPGARITAKGYGDTRPLVLDNSPAGNVKNRRVEFVID